MDRRSRRQWARQLRTELMAAYQPNHAASSSVRHVLPSNRNSSNQVSQLQQQQQYHVVDWITQDPTLLWEPLAGGSTLMHWAAQHLRYEQINHSASDHASNVWKSATIATGTAVVDDPWEWILVQATVASAGTPRLWVDQCDSGGESCLDCFMSAWHNGSRRRDPYQFCAAVEAVRQQPYLVDQLRRLVEQQSSSFSSSCKPLGRASDRRVTLVAKVWKAWQRLCRAAAANDNDDSIYPSLLAFMAKTGRALESFAWLAVTLCPTSSNITRRGETPLHLWAASPTPPADELDALWIQLLRMHPTAVTQPDADGRLPLHLALARANRPVRQACQLALQCPETLGIADPHTAIDGGPVLYPFATAALAARLEVRAVLRATQRRPPSQRLYDWLDTCRRDADAYEQEVSTVLLGHVYTMLRALPQALECNRQAVMAHAAAAEENETATCSTTFHAATTVKDAYAKVLHDLV